MKRMIPLLVFFLHRYKQKIEDKRAGCLKHNCGGIV